MDATQTSKAILDLIYHCLASEKSMTATAKNKH